MITSTVDAGGPTLLLAPVRGLLGDAVQVGPALDAFRPELVGAGAAPEELAGLTQYFDLSEAEPVVPLSGAEWSEVRGLCRFGEVRVPNPSLLEALAWGRGHGVPVEGLDPSEEEVAELFTENIGYVELVRRTVREHRLGRSPPAPNSADAYAVAWATTVGGGRGSRRFAAARDGRLCEAARGRAGGRRLALVVDRERFESVNALLGARS